MPPRKGQGQWALGYREPLNPNERSKRDNDGLLVRQRIIDIYQHTGYRGIDPGDLRGRFRWYGLYTQRRPGIAGGRTAVLEPEDLEDEFFMMRIRIDGGALTTEQLRVVGAISTTYARDTADITDRQNVQLHWIRVEDVPTIWEKLEAVGLSTTEACGDTPRVMLGCPVEGLTTDSVLDAGPALRNTVETYLGDPAFSNLPRKFKTSISGCSRSCTNHEINDVSFVGVLGPDGTAGFDVWVGGGLSTNPMFGQRLGIFVTSDEVPEVWAGVISIFRDYGYRRSRNHARLKFLVSDWGAARFREVLEKEYLNRALPDCAVEVSTPAYRDHIGIESQRDGLTAIGATTRAGRTSGTDLSGLADLCEKVGSPRVALTAQQGVIMIGVPAERTEQALDGLDALNFSARPSAFHRGTIACTGIEFCKLAIVETKGRAESIRQDLESRLPDFDVPITINVNGCPNSCARFQIADIGFKGVVAPGPDGTDVEAFQVHLGGQLGSEAAFGRKFRGLKVTADEASDYAERILKGFVDRREGNESFGSYVVRAEESWLV